MRREATITIQREGRDQGKVFTIREMAAGPAEDWAMRAFMLMVRAGTDVPPNIFSQGFAGFVVMGLGAVLTGLGKAPFHDVKPLMDEMLTCVTSVLAPGAAAATSHPTQIMAQIEEVSTLFQLREEVISIHLGFSLADRLLSFRSLAVSMMAMGSPGETTETSPEPSELSSQAA